MIWKVKLLCNKAPNRSQFWLQFSYFLPRFCTNDLRFSAFFFDGFLALWWTSSDSHLQLDFCFGAGLGFDFTLLHFIGVCGASFHRLKYGDFHTGLKTSFRKTLKYGENETNGIFTIDNRNVLKKKRSQLSNFGLGGRIFYRRARKCARAKIFFGFKKYMKFSTFYIPWMFS